MVGRFVSLLVAPLVRLCKYTPKGDFNCIISPAHLYATGAVMYTALLDASTHLYMRVCPSIGWSVCPSIGPSVYPSIHPTFFFLAEFNWKWHRNHGKLFFNKLKKQFKISAVPFPCSTFLLLFMGGGRAASPIVLKYGGIFCTSICPSVPPSGPSSHA